MEKSKDYLLQVWISPNKKNETPELPFDNYIVMKTECGRWRIEKLLHRGVYETNEEFEEEIQQILDECSRFGDITRYIKIKCEWS